MSDDASTTHWQRRLVRRPVVLLTAVVATASCIALAWRGPSMFWDSSSYAAAADSFAHGHGITTRMVPTFSNYSPTQFLERGARVPFTDFPAGFTIITGLIAVVTGARRALMVVAFVSTGVLVAAIVAGVAAARRRPRDWTTSDRWRVAAIVCFALGVVAFPSYQWMLRAGLSEPAFCACVLGVAVLLVAGGRRHLAAAVVLAGLAGCIRFVGLPIVAVPAVVLWRDRGKRRSLPWIAAAVAPTAINVAWSSAVGGGHRFGLRDISLDDARIALHAMVGWVSNHYGGSLALFFGKRWPVWWAYALAVAWLVAVVAAMAAEALGRRWLPRPMQVTFAMAGVLVGSLFAGMLLFDSYVLPDNRLLLPAGLLTLTGVVWTAIERVDPRIVLVGVVLWIASASEPWTLRPLDRAPDRADLVAAVGDARVVVSDDSDGVWWETGVPAAALPTAQSWLTGADNDQAGELRRLPCALAREHGVIIVTGGAFMDKGWTDRLQAFVESGDLVDEYVGDLVRYSPTGRGC